MLLETCYRYHFNVHRIVFSLWWHEMGGGCCCIRAIDVESPVMLAKWIYSTTRRIRYECKPNYLVTRFTTYPLVAAYQHTEFFIIFLTLQKNFCSAKSLFICVDSIIILFGALVSFFHQQRRIKNAIISISQLNKRTWQKRNDSANVVINKWKKESLWDRKVVKGKE